MLYWEVDQANGWEAMWPYREMDKEWLQHQKVALMEKSKFLNLSAIRGSKLVKICKAKIQEMKLVWSACQKMAIPLQLVLQITMPMRLQIVAI